MNGRQLTRRQFAAAIGAMTLGGAPLFAQQTVIAGQNDKAELDNLMNIFTKTAGGMQFWADIWFFHEWRIQRNAITGHCRLLDGTNHRHASGTLDECRQAFDATGTRDKLGAMRGKAVIVLHGLFRTRSGMQSLCESLAKDGGYSTFNMGYPTTRGSVADHAGALNSVIQNLDGITELNFIGHSLGNLVVRHWLGELIAGQRKLLEGQKLGRMVMLAPPNHHPQIATTLIRGELAQSITGAAATELAHGWDKLSPKLATPPFEFGIIAGGRGEGRGFNPLLPGDDDAVITVESTRLPGARDFRLLPVLHSFIMFDARVKELALRFITHGHFESDEKRQPIA